MRDQQQKVRQVAASEIASHLHAVERLAAFVRDHGSATVERGLERIRKAMLPTVDPSTFPTSPFHLMEAGRSETAWTFWLASVLAGKAGPLCARLLWRAVCRSVVASRSNPEPHETYGAAELATLRDWSAMLDRDVRLRVRREVHDPELGDARLRVAGRVDIVVETSAHFVVIENKVKSGWNDGLISQAEKYRRFGLKHARALSKTLALVVLTKSETFEMGEATRDYVNITYASLGSALRHELLHAVQDGTAELFISLWPALFTVTAIERELVGIDLQRIAGGVGDSWRSMSHVNRALEYLEKGRLHGD